MSIIDRLRSMSHRGARSGGISANSRSVSVMQPSGTLWTPLLGLDFDDYKANFSDIRPIVEQFAMVAPYAVNNEGEQLTPQPNAIQKLYDPNDDMGFYDFADYLASTVLSQSRAIVKVVWANDAGGNLDRIKRVSDNIAGYIFLPPSSRQLMGDGTVRYQFQSSSNTTEYCDSRDVMEFYYSMSTDAYGVGVSPAQASKKWATIEDYIAAYQAGFFQNGAKPDGMFIVTANSYEDYQTAVEKLEKVHSRGSRGHWNYQYAYRPTDENGNPMNGSSVEWVSFGGTNRDLALDTLIKNVQDKKDSAYGVPAIARGNDATATYNNAQVSDRNLARKIDYLLRRTWARFQHELARICEDSIDWHISYTFEVPALADAGKVQAETDATNVNSLITLVNSGATVQGACKALGLNKDWQALTLEPQSTPTLPPSENARKVEASASLKERTVAKLTELTIRQNQRIVDRYASNVSLNDQEPDDDDDLDDEFADDMKDVLDPLAVAAAATALALMLREHKDFKAPAEIKSVDIKAWRERLRRTASTHDEWITRKVLDALDRADDENWTEGQLSDTLEGIVNKTHADVLADNEAENAERFGKLDAALKLARENNVHGYKRWVTAHDDRVCAFCKAMDGKVVALDEPFAEEGDLIPTKEKDYVVDFGDMDTPDAHNRCRCTFVTIFGEPDE